MRESKIGFALGLLALVVLTCGPGSASSQEAPNSGRYGTWSWDGSRWTQLAPTSEGPRFSGEQLFFSPALGGLISAGYREFDTRTYAGTKWTGAGWVTSDASPTPPPPYEGYKNKTAMVLNDADNRILFIDQNSHTMWAWSQGGWTSVVSPSDWPTARYADVEGAAYDPDR